MNFTKDELITILAKFNPWWRGEAISTPRWRRAVFNELFNWVFEPPAPRAVLLSGARQVGKTTLLHQVILDLLEKHNIPAVNILYVTFDHPLIKLAGIDAVIDAWQSREPLASGPQYLFLDEAQLVSNGEIWVKHQVDFNKDRRIIFTGSAMPLIHKWQESGVGRWHTIELSTLSFYEYWHLKLEKQRLNQEKVIGFFKNSESFKNIKYEPFKVSIPPLPLIKSFRELLHWKEHQFKELASQATSYVSHFHEYLMKGGFPQSVGIDDINQAQRLLREDIIDKVLKRDMTALFGVRHVLELERIFLYLCMHDGGLLDLNTLCKNLEVKRPTAEKYIDLLKATHLIYKVQPFGYGKDILRAKDKIYLADAAISSAVLLKGKSLLDDSKALGIATETAVFKHIYSILYTKLIGISYWQGKKKKEVDVIAQINNDDIPFEIKYRDQHTSKQDVGGLYEFCKEKTPPIAYIITKSLDDFGFSTIPGVQTSILRIPAPLFCYWMGQAEHVVDADFNLLV